MSKLTRLAEQVSFMNPEKVGFRLQSKPLGPDVRLRFWIFENAVISSNSKHLAALIEGHQNGPMQNKPANLIMALTTKTMQ